MLRQLSRSIHRAIFPLLLLGNTVVLAQSPSGLVCDTIVTRDNDVLEVKLVDIGARDISFRDCGYIDGPLRHIKKREVHYTSTAVGKREDYQLPRESLKLPSQFGVTLSCVGSSFNFADRPLEFQIDPSIDTLQLWTPSLGFWHEVLMGDKKSTAIRVQVSLSQRGFRLRFPLAMFDFDSSGSLVEVANWRETYTYRSPVISHSYELRKQVLSWCSFGFGIQLQHIIQERGKRCIKTEDFEMTVPPQQGNYTVISEGTECFDWNWNGWERRFDVLPFLKGQLNVGAVNIFCQLEWGIRARYREEYQIVFTDEVGSTIAEPILWEDYAFGRAVSVGVDWPISRVTD